MSEHRARNTVWRTRCERHPTVMSVDAVDERGAVEPGALCPECDAPLELVDVVRNLWRRKEKAT